MKHEHLPALNKYTSPNQYAALQEVIKESSLVGLLMQGRMGTTIGALIRSAWIDSEVIKNDEGVTSERWYVTEAGKHAMQLYEIKAEQDKKKAEAEAECRRIRETLRLQQVESERKVQNLLFNYYAAKSSMDRILKGRWEEVMKAARIANVDSVKFHRMGLMAEEKLKEKKNLVRDSDW
jgi:hypothetical protein